MNEYNQKLKEMEDSNIPFTKIVNKNGNVQFCINLIEYDGPIYRYSLDLAYEKIMQLRKRYSNDCIKCGKPTRFNKYCISCQEKILNSIEN